MKQIHKTCQFKCSENADCSRHPNYLKPVKSLISGDNCYWAHLHLLIRGKSTAEIQNFFRVVSGHIAQEIFRKFPLPSNGGPSPAGGAPTDRKIGLKTEYVTENKKGLENQKQKGCLKNQRKFWSMLVYSRLVSWGREFKSVSQYIVQNTLEALQIIAYRPRRSQFRGDNST